MPEVLNQPQRESAHLISEMKNVSKDNVILTGDYFVSGEVVGKTADGSKYVKLSLDGSADDGAEAKAIVFGSYDASTQDAPGLAHARVAAVRANKLVWPEGITDARKAEFIADLLETQIVTR